MKAILATALIFLCAVEIKAQKFEEKIPSENRRENDSLRNAIKDFVWGNEPKPTITKDESDANYSVKIKDYAKFPELSSTEVYTVHLKNGFTSKIYLFHPVTSNGLRMPVIYHSGHGYGILREDYEVNSRGAYPVSVIQTFLRKGYDVIGIDMPFFGNNEFPLIVNIDGEARYIFSHDDMAILDNPLYYFLAPITTALDYFEKKYGYRNYIMTGLSGGGWTTTLYSSIDTRIQLSFPVAGSIPLPLRGERDKGDFEQEYPEFYEQFNYSTLYYLAASGRGRLQYQVLIKNDDCCFALNGFEYWVPTVRDKMMENRTRGSFRFLYDTITPKHKISSVATDSIQFYVDRFMSRMIKDNSFIGSSTPRNVICDRDSLFLNITPFGNSNVNWYRNGQLLPDTGTVLTVKDAGIYHAAIRNYSGAVAYSDSLTVRKIGYDNLSVRQVNEELFSSAPENNQWYYNGNIISGATDQKYIPKARGKYSVKVVVGKCTWMSDAYDFRALVYPNPVANELHLDFAGYAGTFNFQLLSSTGIVVKKGSFDGHITVETGSLQRGIYFLKVTSNKGFAISRKIVVR